MAATDRSAPRLQRRRSLDAHLLPILINLVTLLILVLIRTLARNLSTSRRPSRRRQPQIRTMENREWHYQTAGQSFLVSTAPELLQDKYIHDFLARPEMYWASDISPEELAIMRRTSVILGLYLKTDTGPGLETIGMARLVTDQMTIIYLTDVLVLPEHQGKGLGKWLIQCVADLAKAMPRLRRITLMAKNERHAIQFYDSLLGAKVFDQVGGKVVFMSSKMEGLDSVLPTP